MINAWAFGWLLLLKSITSYSHTFVGSVCVCVRELERESWFMRLSLLVCAGVCVCVPYLCECICVWVCVCVCFPTDRETCRGHKTTSPCCIVNTKAARQRSHGRPSVLRWEPYNTGLLSPSCVLHGSSWPKQHEYNRHTTRHSSSERGEKKNTTWLFNTNVTCWKQWNLLQERQQNKQTHQHEKTC